MRNNPSSTLFALFSLSLVACAGPPGDGDDLTTAAARETPSAGSPGAGDSLFPTLGNGGYDVVHYDLRLRYETADPAQPLDGTVTIIATATQALSQFDLDFGGDAIGDVTVDGRRAAWHRDGEELVIAPSRAIGRGQPFVVQVSHFRSTPKVPDPNDFLGAPFFVTPDGSAWAGQPDGSHRIFPCNDHPIDKASFTFTLDVPAGAAAVANGVALGHVTVGGRALWLYVQGQPMATELAQVAVGDYTVIDRGRHDGIAVRDVVPSRLAAALEPALAVTGAQLDWLQERVGRYPFDVYGSLAVDAGLGFALETQTISLFETDFFASYPPEVYEPIMLHELSHQWFGDSVAPTRWADVWQNEGHATWYELTSQLDPDSPDFVDYMQFIYSLYDLLAFYYGPVGDPLASDALSLFNPNVYYGGALVLYALRQEVGDTTFRAIERTWVTRYRGQSASTADFMDLASEVAGRDLHPFLAAWLYGDTAPPMPGHPEWTVEPATPMASARIVGLLNIAPIPSEELGAMHVMKR